jgi:phage gp46-like protein
MITKPDRFSGDPKIYIDENGADLDFRGGQPVMDSGLENAVNISLFTREGWWGNDIMPDDNKIGSRLEVTSEQPITSSSLGDVEQSAENALAWMVNKQLAKEIAAIASNPNGRAIKLQTFIQPPFGTATELLTLKNGVNWINQKLDPASEK